MKDVEDIYKGFDYEIRIYKTKDMECSKQVITGNNILGLKVGVASFLTSCLDTKIVTEKELQDMVKVVLKARKKGIKNRVIYNSLEEE